MSDILTSKQDANQVLRLAYDDATKSLRTTGGGSGSGVVTQPDGSLLHVTVDASALPTGAATEAKQDDQTVLLTNIATTSGEVATNTLAANSSLSTIATNTTGSATEASLTALISALNAFAEKTKSTDVTEAHDYKSFTFVTSGNGVGQVQTITYRLGGDTGTVVATQTFVYDSESRVISIAKT